MHGEAYPVIIAAKTTWLTVYRSPENRYGRNARSDFGYDAGGYYHCIVYGTYIQSGLYER